MNNNWGNKRVIGSHFKEYGRYQEPKKAGQVLIIDK